MMARRDVANKINPAFRSRPAIIFSLSVFARVRKLAATATRIIEGMIRLAKITMINHTLSSMWSGRYGLVELIPKARTVVGIINMIPASLYCI